MKTAYLIKLKLQAKQVWTVESLRNFPQNGMMQPLPMLAMDGPSINQFILP